jgi:predicted nuclease with TOPRIM domain
MSEEKYKDGVWLGTDAEISLLPEVLRQFVRKLQSDNDQLRQKLKVVEEANKSLLETLNRRVKVIQTLTEKLDKVEAVIREAQEQKPVAYRYRFTRNGELQDGYKYKEEKSLLDLPEDALYLSPVPAMPIQDDKQL